MKQLIINADDLGMCRGANRGVLRAHQEGVVTSASLMVNLPALDDAVQQVVAVCPNLGVGLHLNLTCGRPIATESDVPLLVDRDGRFRPGFLQLWRRRAVSGSRGELAQQIAAELRAQFDRAASALAAIGRTLDHVNGHQHIHTIPGVWDTVLELTEEFGIGTVRLSRERWRLGRGGPALASVLPRGNLLKQQLLAHVTRKNLNGDAVHSLQRRVRPEWNLIGILDSGRLDERTLLARLQALPVGVTELLIHPSQAGLDDNFAELSRSDRDFQREPWRERELAALCSSAVRRCIDEQGIRLTNFRELYNQAPARSAALA